MEEPWCTSAATNSRTFNGRSSNPCCSTNRAVPRADANIDEKMTAHQRRRLEHFCQAGLRICPEGVRAPARYKGLDERAGRGDEGEHGPSHGRIERIATAEKWSPFVAVRVAPLQAVTENSVTVLRLQHACGPLLEFGGWPLPQNFWLQLWKGAKLRPHRKRWGV